MRCPKSRSHVRSMIIAFPVLISSGLALVACSGSPTALTSRTTTSVSKTTRSTQPPKMTTTTTAPPQQTFSLYFVRGTELGVSQRTTGTTADPHYESMVDLLQGPNPTETAAGLSTAIPQGTTMRGLEIRGGTATVNFSPTFVQAAPPPSLSARLAQVVYTITAFPNVNGVIIQVGGTRIVNFAGVNLSQPVGRSQVTAALPEILLEEPAVGGSLSGNLTVSGLTSFNGTYEIQLVDPSGKLLASVTSTAVVDARFEQTIPFTITSPETGTVRVFARPLSPTQAVEEYQFTVSIAP